MVISKYCFWQFESCWRELKLRKLVTKDRIRVSWTCFRGRGEGGAPLELHVLFWEWLLGSANVEKWADHQKKKFFTDNAVQALIAFQEGHPGLLKVYVHLGEGVLACEKGRKFSLKWKNNAWGSYSKSIGILFVFWPSKRRYESSNEEKMGRQQNEKVVQLNVGKHCLTGWELGRVCEDSEGHFMYDDPL